MGYFNKGRHGGGEKKFGGQFGGGKPLHQATCTECGNACEVPFKPFPGKSVYCRNCFKKEGAPRDSRDFRDSRDSKDFRDSRDFKSKDRPMFDAVCADCGNRCEVPFRPSGEKPVYCRNCFGHEKSDNFMKKPEPSHESFDQLNKKLDKILRALEILQGKQTFIVKKPEAEIAEMPISEAKPEKAAAEKPATKPKKPKKKAA